MLRSISISDSEESYDDDDNESCSKTAIAARLALVFGYFNRNWEETFHIPTGPNNVIEPGDPDRGQPTYFQPRRNRFLFRIRVPADFGDQEIVWSVTTHGKTERTYATLIPEYFIDKLVITANSGGAGGTGGADLTLHDNEPPTRTVTAGQPVALAAFATDDGVPARGPTMSFPTSPLRPGPVTFVGATGLRLSWFVYRGPGDVVTFDPPQATTWEETRFGANSPWTPGWKTPPPPDDGRWMAQVTFAEPGTYVL